MARYEVLFKRSVAKDLRSAPRKDVARILKRVEELRDEPRCDGCEKLSGQERYRIRQGNYRIIYEIIDQLLIVTVIEVAHRKDVYKQH